MFYVFGSIILLVFTFPSYAKYLSFYYIIHFSIINIIDLRFFAIFSFNTLFLFIKIFFRNFIFIFYKGCIPSCAYKYTTITLKIFLFLIGKRFLQKIVSQKNNYELILLLYLIYFLFIYNLINLIIFIYFFKQVSHPFSTLVKKV